jgi:hypothetical protein
MMGTLATLMEGDIENVAGVLKITTIRVKYHLKATVDKVDDARECFSNYITRCPAAQSVIGCIRIEDELCFEK